VQFSLWTKYDLEPGYDLVYLDYSFDEGSTWSENDQALAIFNGHRDWYEVIIGADELEGQPSVTLRFRLVSDGGVTYDGIYIDDLVLSYQPYVCTYGWDQIYLPVISK
jgi:immune inhibitor A